MGNVCVKINIFLRERRRFGALFFDPEDGDGMFLRKVGCLLTKYIALYPRRYDSS
jgi:hypothetical protein